MNTVSVNFLHLHLAQQDVVAGITWQYPDLTYIKRCKVLCTRTNSVALGVALGVVLGLTSFACNYVASKGMFVCVPI